MPGLVLPEGYSYVAGSLLSTVWLLAYQNIVVSRHRRAARIEYPQLYAEKAEAQASKAAHLFNCAQRAHQNTLENMPVVMITTLLTGLKYPVFAASACGLWSFARVLYTIGYTTGDPAKRNTRGGGLGSLASLALLASSTYAVFQLIQGGI